MQFNSDCFHKSQTFFFFDWWKEKIDKKLVFKKNLSTFFCKEFNWFESKMEQKKIFTNKTERNKWIEKLFLNKLN